MHKRIKDPLLVAIQWVSKTNRSRAHLLVDSQWVNKNHLKIKALHLGALRLVVIQWTNKPHPKKEQQLAQTLEATRWIQVRLSKSQVLETFRWRPSLKDLGWKASLPRLSILLNYLKHLSLKLQKKRRQKENSSTQMHSSQRCLTNSIWTRSVLQYSTRHLSPKKK